MSIDRVIGIANQIVSMQQEILDHEAKIKELKAQLRYIREFVAPEATDQLEWDPLNMSYEPAGDIVTIALPNGMILTVGESFHPHTPKKDNAKREEILEWVEANGGAALLTLDLTLSFRRGEGERARTVLAALDSIPVEYTKEKGIHHSLYQTFCRDRVREGKDLPELLGVFNRREASVAAPISSDVKEPVLPKVHPKNLSESETPPTVVISGTNLGIKASGATQKAVKDPLATYGQ